MCLYVRVSTQQPEHTQTPIIRYLVANPDSQYTYIDIVILVYCIFFIYFFSIISYIKLFMKPGITPICQLCTRFFFMCESHKSLIYIHVVSSYLTSWRTYNSQEDNYVYTYIMKSAVFFLVMLPVW